MNGSTAGPPNERSVGVIVGTFGDQSWIDLARLRALPSAYRQTTPAAEVIHLHADTLHEARNTAVSQLATEWVIVLDADDELDEAYLERMLEGSGDVRQPSTLGVYADGSEDDAPVLIPKRPLEQGNYLVVGAMVRRSLFLKVGGYRDLPIAEDWDFFLRCERVGAVITQCPAAVYRVHVNPAGRNQMPPREWGQVYRRIRQGS